MKRINLTEIQKKWLSHVIDSGIIHQFPLSELNKMNERCGTSDKYSHISKCVRFCQAILNMGHYCNRSDDKRLNAIREMYLMYRKK
jgi:hypothetical protein